MKFSGNSNSVAGEQKKLDLNEAMVQGGRLPKMANNIDFSNVLQINFLLQI